MQSTFKFVAAASLLAAIMVSPVHAQSYAYSAEGGTYPAQDTGRDHRGVFLRAAVGLGFSGMYGSLSQPGVEESLSISGISSLWNFAVGGSVTERLALHGVYFGGSVFAPNVTYEVNGEEYSDSDLDTSLTLHNVGAGLTYYTFSNLYLSAQLALAFASVTDFDSNDSAGIGPGFAVGGLIGKEWFVARQLGIGFAVQLNFARIVDDDGAVEFPWYVINGGPMFSLTFN